MFFFRDAKKNEVDLILRNASCDCAVEIKAASGFSSSMLKGLDYWDRLIAQNSTSEVHGDPEHGDPERGDPERGDPEHGDPTKPLRKFLIYAGQPETVGNTQLVSWTDTVKLLL